MSSPVTTEPATIWRAGRRRFITLRAACRHAAELEIVRKYPCDCEFEAGACWRHREHDYFERLRTRFARLIQRHVRTSTRTR